MQTKFLPRTKNCEKSALSFRDANFFIPKFLSNFVACQREYDIFGKLSLVAVNSGGRLRKLSTGEGVPSNHVVLKLRIHMTHTLFAHFLMEAETDYHTILGDVIN